MPITLGAYGTANAVTVATAGNFIPEQWSSEIVAAHKAELIVVPLVRTISMIGKKGDTIHVPAPTRGQGSQKIANQDVRIQQDTESEIIISLDQHWEYSRLIEDIVDVQANPELRQFYTDDAAYALSLIKDRALIQLGRSANAGNGTAAYNAAFVAGDGNTLYTGANQTAVTAAGIRRCIQRMDDSFLPMNGRFFVMPPVGRSVLNSIQEFTANSFTGESGKGNVIRNGMVGDLYNVPVFITPNADTATGGARIGMFGHKDSLVLVEQLGIRSQVQYKQEKLATLYTADTLFGVRNLRTGSDPDIPAGIFTIAMPA